MKRTVFCLIWLGLLLGGRVQVSAQVQGVPDPLAKLARTHCADCHTGEGSAANFDFERLQWDLTDEAGFAQWVQVYDRVGKNEMPPADADQPSNAERSAFLQTLGMRLRDHELAVHRRVGRTRMRRLNRAEYENTVHDLLGIDVPLKHLLPEDTPAHGFDTVTEGLRISPVHIQRYLDAADVALDAAIHLTAKPQVQKKRHRYQDEEEVIENLRYEHGRKGKGEGKHRRLFRELDDAVVFISPGWAPNTLKSFVPPVDGTYRVRCSAYAYNSGGKPVTLQVMSTNWKVEQLQGYFDMPPDKPRTVELDVRITQRERLQIVAFNVGQDPEGETLWNIDDLDKLDVPGLAVQWVEIEGPLIKEWPPESTTELVGRENVRKRKRRGPWTPAGHLEYELTANDPRAAATTLIERFAAKAFRQSTPSHVAESLRDSKQPSESLPASSNTPGDENTAAAPYVAIAMKELDAGRSLEEALRVALRAILVSPRFLVLDESPGKLDDFALASRLSYFLWNTMPDDDLLKAASDGKLTNPEVYRRQFRRLLHSPRSDRFVTNFLAQWLELQSIDATNPDTSLYPEYDLLLRHAMLTETESFFRELLDNDLPIRNLIDSDFVMLNSRLAEHYDMDLPASDRQQGEQFRRVAISKDIPRGGILTHASVLKVTANGTVTSPVRRGIWVMRHLLGQPPPPPPAVPAVEPDTRGTTTIREQLAQHRNSAVCNSCHKSIDPPGFALESYDVIGGFRDRYRSDGKGESVKVWVSNKFFWSKNGPPVDASGELPDGSSFADTDEFKKLLLRQERQVLRNLAEQLVIYGTGSPIRFIDRKQVDHIVKVTEEHGGGLRTLLQTIVESPMFKEK